MFTYSENKNLTGDFFVNALLLPNLTNDDEELLEIVRQKINLNKILKSNLPFVFIPKESEVKKGTDNTFVVVRYSIYIKDHLYCPVNELLCPDYFEIMYDDMDSEFELNETIDLAGLNFTKIKFGKYRDGWRRIE